MTASPSLSPTPEGSTKGFYSLHRETFSVTVTGWVVDGVSRPEFLFAASRDVQRDVDRRWTTNMAHSPPFLFAASRDVQRDCRHLWLYGRRKCFYSLHRETFSVTSQ